MCAMRGKRTSERSESDTTWKVTELERTICELGHAVFELDRHIESEEARTKHYDPRDFAYSNFAKSARERRERLRATIRRVKMELEVTRRESRNAAQGTQHRSPLLLTPRDF